MVRATVEKGQKELQTGLVCVEIIELEAKKNEQKWANLRNLVAYGNTLEQKLKSTFCYARISAGACEKPDSRKRLPDSELLVVNARRRVKSNGLSFKKTQKSKSEKNYRLTTFLKMLKANQT